MFFGFSASSDDDETITEIVRGTIAEDENDRTEILSSFFVSFRFCIGTFKVREREKKERMARARVFFRFSASSDDDEKITEIVRGTIAEDENDVKMLSSSVKKRGNLRGRYILINK